MPCSIPLKNTVSTDTIKSMITLKSFDTSVKNTPVSWFERRGIFYKKFKLYILQMQYPFLNFLCSALIPELCSDVSAGTSCNVELALITVSAMRAFPYELSVILDDLDLAVVAAYLTVIALRIQLRVHDIVIDVAA